MSRSKRDILDTEAMLQRLTSLLSQCREDEPPHEAWRNARTDAESLRRISMTLHRWHELECGDSNNYSSWAIVRGRKSATGIHGARKFIHDDNGVPFIERHYYSQVSPAFGGRDSVTYSPIPDRERGAQKRLYAIMARYPSLTAYIQTDPRGCALYILRPGDVPEGGDVSAYYSRGLAVSQ